MKQGLNIFSFLLLTFVLIQSVFGSVSKKHLIGNFSYVAVVYDGNLVTEEIDLLDPNKKIIRSYTWGLDPAGTKQQVGGIGALVSMEETQADNSVKTFHVVSDAGGNVTNLVESHADGSLTMANTYEYGPFGQVISKTESVEMPYQFNTKMVDSETGLVYYGYRFYDAADGRWLNRDPIGVNGGINVYNSVSNNMVNGYSGGISHSGGMEKYVGNLENNFRVDAWGEVAIKEGQVFKFNAGIVTITKYRRHPRILKTSDPQWEKLQWKGHITTSGVTVRFDVKLNKKVNCYYRWRQKMDFTDTKGNFLIHGGRLMKKYIDGSHTIGDKIVFPKLNKVQTDWYYTQKEFKNYIKRHKTNFMPLQDSPFFTDYTFLRQSGKIGSAKRDELGQNSRKAVFINFTTELVQVQNPKAKKGGKVHLTFHWGFVIHPQKLYILDGYTPDLKTLEKQYRNK